VTEVEEVVVVERMGEEGRVSVLREERCRVVILRRSCRERTVGGGGLRITNESFPVAVLAPPLDPPTLPVLPALPALPALPRLPSEPLGTGEGFFAPASPAEALGGVD